MPIDLAMPVAGEPIHGPVYCLKAEEVGRSAWGVPELEIQIQQPLYSVKMQGQFRYLECLDIGKSVSIPLPPKMALVISQFNKKGEKRLLAAPIQSSPNQHFFEVDVSLEKLLSRDEWIKFLAGESIQKDWILRLGHPPRYCEPHNVNDYWLSWGILKTRVTFQKDLNVATVEVIK